MASITQQIDFLVNNPRLNEIMTAVRKHATVTQPQNMDTILKQADDVQNAATNYLNSQTKEQKSKTLAMHQKTAALICLYNIAAKVNA